MTNILLLGNGQMGSAVRADLEDCGYKVTAVDTTYTQEGLSCVEYGDQVCIDLVNTEALRSLIRAMRHDLAICCLPSFLGYQTIETCIEEGLNCIDMSFTEKDLSELDHKAKANGVVVYHDVGFAPGIPNLIVGSYLYGYAGQHCIPDVRIYAGGMAANSASNKYGYVVTWSIDDMESEFKRPARYKEDKVIRSVDPLDSMIELVQIGPFIFETFITDGVRSMLNNDKIYNIVERTARWPGFINKVRRPLSPFADKYNNFKKEMENHCMSGRDLVVLRVDIGRHSHEMVVYPSPELTAMARCTAGTCAAVADTILTDSYIRRESGVRPLEQTNMWESVSRRLERRNIFVTTKIR